ADTCAAEDPSVSLRTWKETPSASAAGAIIRASCPPPTTPILGKVTGSSVCAPSGEARPGQYPGEHGCGEGTATRGQVLRRRHSRLHRRHRHLQPPAPRPRGDGAAVGEGPLRHRRDDRVVDRLALLDLPRRADELSG